MKRIALNAAAILVGVLGLFCVATFAWTTWVMSTGGGWLLAFMFNESSSTVPSGELWSVSAAIACFSFWAAARIFRKSRTVIPPT